MDPSFFFFNSFACLSVVAINKLDHSVSILIKLSMRLLDCFSLRDEIFFDLSGCLLVGLRECDDLVIDSLLGMRLKVNGLALSAEWEGTLD
jgi:hypothetical protein